MMLGMLSRNTSCAAGKECEGQPSIYWALLMLWDGTIEVTIDMVYEEGAAI